MKIRPEITALKDEMIAVRRDIHQHPELGFQETRTAKLVADQLREYGLDVRTGVGNTGVTGELAGSQPGPRIAFRADMDALPMEETGTLPFKSVNKGVMHACGHDGHVAMLLGAAKSLAEIRDGLKGSIRFIFQPAEEGAGGARYMIRDGALEGVDEIYGAHLWNYQPFGTVGVKAGPVMAAADQFKITVKGIGGHGAAPQGTDDTVVIGAQLVIALQTIVSRNTNPLESTVITVGQFQAGSGFNIIANEAYLYGTARSYTRENRQMIKDRMKTIIDGFRTAYNVDIDFYYEDGYPPTVNTAAATEKARVAAEKIAGKGVIDPFMTMGGEDFSYYLEQIPGSYFYIGSMPEKSEPGSVPHHCSHFDIDERALQVGASIFYQLAEDLLA